MTRGRQIIVNIEYLQGCQNVDNKKMARVMGVSLATFQNRKNTPSKLTMGEIEKAAKFFQIPAERLLVPFIPGEVTKQIITE